MTNRPKILVVDDDFDVRDSLCDVLADEGYQVEGVGDGQEALDRLRAGHRPGLILLDLMMPRMDGERFCILRSQEPALTRIPVVLLSADAHIEEKVKRMGASGHLRKPVNLSLLLETIRGLLQRLR